MGYFARPLPAPDLSDLRTLWKEAQKQAPQQMLQRLKAFADAHPHPETSAPESQETTADDLECVAWMWVI